MRPALVEHVVAPALEAALGRPTFRFLRRLRQSQWWEPERLAAHRLERLAVRVGEALRIPAYADHAGLPPEWRPDRLSDLSLLRPLRRRDLSRRGHELVDLRVPGGVFRSSTGGSTGEPVRFFVDRRRQAFDRAARMRAQEWWGIGPGDREAYVWGSPLEQHVQGRLRSLRDRAVNDLLLPAFELHERTAAAWFLRLARFRPACLFGYPSTLSVFCRLLLRRGLRLTGVGIRAVVCTGELLLPEQRAVIGECTGAPVANQYGSRDGGFVAQECPSGSLHVTAEGVLVEVLEGDRPARPEEAGELVVTHLESRATPIIRYRTGDVGRLADGRCECGRVLPALSEIRGRRTDLVITPDGRFLHALALIYVVRETPGIVNYRIDQTDVDALRVRVVADEELTEAGADALTRRIGERVGDGVRVTLERVDSIPPDPSGKHRFVFSEVARDREAAL